MMKFIRHIVMLVAFIAATSCSFSELDDIVTDTPGESSQIQVVGRVAQYSDCDVATRSKKEGDESKVTSMGLALFPIENGTIGNCIYYDFELGGSIVFIVDRHQNAFDDYDGKQFAMYIFANMQDIEGFPQTSEDGKDKSLEDFTKYAANANSNIKEVPENGFPMIGSLGNTISTPETDGINPDGNTLVLKPAQIDDNLDGLPLVNGSPTDNLEIPLKSLYAKFSFTISVKPDQEIVGNKAPRFDLLSYAVNNIAKTVDSNSSTNNDNDVIATSGDVIMGSYAQGATTATFDFYLPERYLTPSNTDIDNVLPDALKKGAYDESVDADEDGYRDEDEKYHQRFKNKLTDGKKATYVTIKGKYTDHHENTYDVDYNIYLGGNNYDDFNIIRNTHYDNSVTIRGISASDDQSTNEESISIDWRVNVNRSTPLVIGLRRESLLDAHFEVRPLRLRLVGEDIPTGTSATVQILNEDGTETNIPGWIRLEKSGTSSNHITTGISAGKRKYFTTNLVTETLAGSTSVTMNNLNGSNQTVWIYVDENTTTTSRAAIVRVSYQGVDKDFKIVQNGLYYVEVEVDGSDNRKYYIEQHEEYLYNYDSEDSYGQTKDEGMPWGLNTVQLSSEHESFTINETNGDWTDWVEEHPNLLTYDFYIKKHDETIASASGAKMIREYAGQAFTAEIFTKSKGKVDEVEVLTMADQASGAVEYCYNRNKRDANGNIVKVEWYLPSADELEDIIVAGYSSFEEFQDNYYWTSQPAYIRNIFYYEYKNYGGSVQDAYSFIVYEDNKDYARATKVVSLGNDQYDYAKSGLNDVPNDPSDRETLPSEEQNLGTIELGYFNVWNQWKRSMNWLGRVQIVDNPETEKDQYYWETKDGSEKNKRYYAYLPHLLDMAQEGYQPRTKNNRVRCAYKSN